MEKREKINRLRQHSPRCLNCGRAHPRCRACPLETCWAGSCPTASPHPRAVAPVHWRHAGQVHARQPHLILALSRLSTGDMLGRFMPDSLTSSSRFHFRFFLSCWATKARLLMSMVLSVRPLLCAMEDTCRSKDGIPSFFSSKATIQFHLWDICPE